MLNVRIPDDLRDLIDAVRGDVPRERWIRRTLEAALSSSETPEPPREEGPRRSDGTVIPRNARAAYAERKRQAEARQQALNDAKAKKR